MSHKTLSFGIGCYQQKVTGIGTKQFKNLFKITRKANDLAEQGFKPRPSGSKDYTFIHDLQCLVFLVKTVKFSRAAKNKREKKNQVLVVVGHTCECM